MMLQRIPRKLKKQLLNYEELHLLLSSIILNLPPVTSILLTKLRASKHNSFIFISLVNIKYFLYCRYPFGIQLKQSAWYTELPIRQNRASLGFIKLLFVSKIILLTPKHKSSPCNNKIRATCKTGTRSSRADQWGRTAGFWPEPEWKGN